MISIKSCRSAAERDNEMIVEDVPEGACITLDLGIDPHTFQIEQLLFIIACPRTRRCWARLRSQSRFCREWS